MPGYCVSIIVEMEVNRQLIERYYKGDCTEAERTYLEKWLMAFDAFDAMEKSARNKDSRGRMWSIIAQNTIGGHDDVTGGFKKRSLVVSRKRLVAAASTLLFLLGASYIWLHLNLVPEPIASVVVDNTGRSLMLQNPPAGLLISQSANSSVKRISRPGSSSSTLFSNTLTIENKYDTDVWVYLKTSSGTGNTMKRFLCRKKKVYVAGFINEHSAKGSRKYLFTKQSDELPKEVLQSIQSHLNAAVNSLRFKDNTPIII